MDAEEPAPVLVLYSVQRRVPQISETTDQQMKNALAELRDTIEYRRIPT